MAAGDGVITGALVSIVTAVGLLVGSFLNVVIYRVPLGKSIVFPGSACPRCGAAIRWHDNIPVLSWVLLRGRCRSCAGRISARYPLVELATGLLFSAVALRFAPSFTAPPASIIANLLVLAAFLYLAAIAVALAAIDLETHKLPNVLVLPAYVVGLLLLGAASFLVGDFSFLLRAAIGAAALFVAYSGMALAYPGGMGFGDVKLAGALGLFLGFLGWGALLVGAFAAFLLGGVFSIGLIVARRASRKSGIPFGPWMLAGAFVGIFGGEQLWSGYLELVGLR